MSDDSKLNAVDPNFAFPETEVPDEEMGAVRDVLTQGEEEAAQAELIASVMVTPEQIARFLKEFYRVEGYLTYPDLWKRDESFFLEIAIGIEPQINAWCAMFPVLGQAIHTVTAAGAWGRLVWDQGMTWWQVYGRKKAAKEEGSQNENGRQQPVAVTAEPIAVGREPVRTTGDGKPNPFLIDYPFSP